MKTKGWLAIALLCLVIAGVIPPAESSANDSQIVDSASGVLREFMALPNKSIPQSLLKDAKGIAILPRVVKGGFVVGVYHGRGVILTRDEASRWQPPMMVNFSGAGVGWQAGLASTDLVLVFRTAGSVQRVLEKKFTIGVDASAAAGPIGREADTNLTAEVLSYSRSKGLFLGISVEGSALQLDAPATQVLYRTSQGVPELPVPANYPVPKSAENLMALLTQLTSAPEPMNVGDPRSVVVGQPYNPPPMPVATPSADAVRLKLAASSDRLSTMIDDTWRRYLALPREVSAGGAPPSPESIAAVLRRYESIAADPRYAPLQQRPEFGATQQLLREYYELLVARPGSLNLPPPPPGPR